MAENGRHELTLTVEALATLVGVVLEDGKPLAGARVRVVKESNFPDFDMGGGEHTDGAGRFRLADQPLGTLKFEVTHPSRVMPQEIELELTEGSNETRVELLVSIVEGLVVGPDGEPIAGAKVTASRAGGGGTSRAVMFVSSVSDDGEGGGGLQMGGGPEPVLSNEDGRYTLRGVAAEIEIRIEASKRGWKSAISEGLEVAEGGLRRGVDLTLTAGGTIVVTYGDSGMWLVLARRVDAEPGSGARPASGMLRGGETKLSDLEPGRYTVSLRSVGGPQGAGAGDDGPEPVEVVVVAGKDVEARFE